MGERGVDEPYDGQKQQLDRRLHLVGVDLVRSRRRRPTAVRHDDVQAAEGLGSGTHCSVDVCSLSNVAGEGQRPDPLGLTSRGGRGGARA